MKSINKWLGLLLFFWATWFPLLVQASTLDYSKLIILIKEDVPGFETWTDAPGRDAPISELKQLVPSIKPVLPASKARTGEAVRALKRHRLDRYFIVDTSRLTEKQAEALAVQLKKNPLVEKADFEPRVDGMHDDNGSLVAPASGNAIPDYTGRQNYLQGKNAVAPYKIGGVNAVQAWKVPGGKGQNMHVISSEIDHWSYNHLDLPKPYLEVYDPQDPATVGSHDTASAGIIVARENDFGTTGIAPDAQLGYLQWGSDRFMQLAERLNEGDVVQLGVQYGYGSFPEVGCWQDCYMPLEDYEPVRDTISYLTEEKGVHVILAAANGNINLDHPYFEGYFDRNLFDSGAIYAGAVDPKTGLRAGFSEYGSRVDLFSWGDFVTTTTWSRQNPTTGYTHDYSGTSSSNPILAGVVASLQGVARANGLGNIPPKALRALLVTTGYPQINGNSSEIGVQPDLEAAIEKMLAARPNRPPVGTLEGDSTVASGKTITFTANASDPDGDPFAYSWKPPIGFTGAIGNTRSVNLTAPTVSNDVSAMVNAEVSDGRGGVLPLHKQITVKAPTEDSCGDIPKWDPARIYETYAEAVAYKGKVYKQNFYNINKPPDVNSAEFGKEWLQGIACR